MWGAKMWGTGESKMRTFLVTLKDGEEKELSLIPFFQSLHPIERGRITGTETRERTIKLTIPEDIFPQLYSEIPAIQKKLRYLDYHDKLHTILSMYLRYNIPPTLTLVSVSEVKPIIYESLAPTISELAVLPNDWD